MPANNQDSRKLGIEFLAKQPRHNARRQGEGKTLAREA
jgi:hypothetical protein